MMGAMMDGERLHDEHRRKFWRTLGIAGLGGVPVGFAVGLGTGLFGGDLNAFWSWAPDWVVLLLIGISAALVGFGSWRFYRSIDEVELQDNLWSNSAAYGAYALLFPCWWALGKAGITSEPNHWLIFLAALGAGLLGYGVRKWRAR